jgi:hypothetical protein
LWYCIRCWALSLGIASPRGELRLWLLVSESIEKRRPDVPVADIRACGAIAHAGLREVELCVQVLLREQPPRTTESLDGDRSSPGTRPMLKPFGGDDADR